MSAENCGQAKSKMIRAGLGFQMVYLIFWFIFMPRIPIRVQFGGSSNVKCWYFYDHLEYFTAI
jgi:hypothetical protein